MIKRTLYFGNPAYLKKDQLQLRVEFPREEEKPDKTVPIEDIGIVILDHPRVTITQSLLTALIENNAALLSCDDRHLPSGLFMPMSANHVYTEKLRYQLEASEPLRKNLWQQTVRTKIQNQARVLRSRGEFTQPKCKAEIERRSCDGTKLQYNLKAIHNPVHLCQFRKQVVTALSYNTI